MNKRTSMAHFILLVMLFYWVLVGGQSSPTKQSSFGRLASNGTPRAQRSTHFRLLTGNPITITVEETSRIHGAVGMVEIHVGHSNQGSQVDEWIVLLLSEIVPVRSTMTEHTWDIQTSEVIISLRCCLVRVDKVPAVTVAAAALRFMLLDALLSVCLAMSFCFQNRAS